MSITSGFKKFKNHIKNGDGTYSLQSLWTSAQTVECADGSTVEDKIGGLKGITTDLTTTETGYAADMSVVGQLNSDLAGIQTSFSQARADLISALASKGVTVSNNATISECIMQIQNISTGKIINCGNGTIMGGTKTHSIKSYYSNYQKLTSSNFLVNPNSLYRGAYDGGQNYTYSIKKSYNSSTGILTFTMESKEFSDLTRLNYTLYLIVY